MVFWSNFSSYSSSPPLLWPVIHILRKYHLSSAVLLKLPTPLTVIQYDDRSASSIEETRCAIIILLCSGSPSQSLTYQGICSCIYCTGRVIQDQDLWFLEKSPCNTQTLLLTAGYTALNDHCIVAIRDSLTNPSAWASLQTLRTSHWHVHHQRILS